MSRRAVALTLVLCTFLKLWDNVSVLGQNSGAVPPEAQKLFEDVEKSVQLIAESAVLNYRNRQELRRSCNTKSRCSVDMCKPVKLEADNSHCLAFPGEHSCQGSHPLGCKNASFSTSSYIELPRFAVAGRLTCDVQMTICAQKDLDSQAFEKVYLNHGSPFNTIAWARFADSNGVHRRYPGLEKRPDTCSSVGYDPRKRSWYKAVTAVSKQIIVMIDAGGPMANPLSIALGPSAQIVTAAQRIVTEFLDTLNTDDVVWVYTFDYVGPKLVSKKVNIPAEDEAESNGATLDRLKEDINDIRVTTAVGAANLTAALESVLLGEGFDTSLAKSLKILLIITAGELAEGPSGSISSDSPIVQFLTTNEVRTFIYHLNDSSSEADVSSATDLKSVACTIGGVYNSVPRDNILDDPIWAVQSFYSFVASLRFELDTKKPLWVPSYLATSGIGELLSVVYPVFDGSILIGVASIDLLRDAVEARWRGAIDNWRKPADSKQDIGSMLNCNVTLTPDASDCSSDVVPDGGLCLNESFTFAGPATAEAYAQRTCCWGSCAPSGGERGTNLKSILVATLLPTSAVLVITVLLLCRRFKLSLPTAEVNDETDEPSHQLKLVTDGQEGKDSVEDRYSTHVL